jgi:transposase
VESYQPAGPLFKKTWRFAEVSIQKRRIYLTKWYKLKDRPLVYLDETAFAPDAPRTHGWSRKGSRCYGRISGNRRPRTSLIAAQYGKALLAPMLLTGTVNTAVFNGWVEQMLLPELPPQSVVIMDNAAFHKHPTTRKLLENAGHTLLYLPPYSPDLNPIEHRWAQLKALRRRSGLSPDELLTISI